MNNSDLREHLVCKVAHQIPNIGKTGMMKAMYFLQQIYKVPLGYDFNIYNYGPYDEDVLVTLDCAEKGGFINIQSTFYENGVTGYEISAKTDVPLAPEYSEHIDKISKNFNKYTAKQWELTSTIVYLYVAYNENDWNFDELDDNVQRIKPHFDIETIKAERNRLENLNILSDAIQ